MLFRHIDYFELKTLEKEQMHGGHSFFSLLKAGDEVPIWKLSHLHKKKRNILIIRGEESRPGEICAHKPIKLIFPS